MALTKVTTAVLNDGTVTNNKLGAEFTTSSIMATDNVDFSVAQVFTKTLSAATNITFSNYSIGGVKDLVITGVQTLSFTTGTVNVAAGEYDGTLSNLIQVLCTDATTPTFWITISQPQ